MRRRTFLPAVLGLLAAASPALAVRPVAAEDVPRADPRLVRALNEGKAELPLLIGMRDGTPSARSLMLRPEPAREPERRKQRLTAQRRLASEISSERFRASHFYASFSMMAGNATREGAVEIANRSDVDWVTVAGTKRRASAPQALIRSDQANTLGFRGGGLTVAVLDTGVDYRVTELGGPSFPNDKVIAGIDTADEDSDPLDCDGHGTSVAAIVATDAGVAPEARIVAVKVFSSTNPESGNCVEEAQDADILQGIDWVITNREAYDVTAINLSLGGAFEGGADLGFCDSLVPEYTTAVEMALAEGIVVLAASGNDLLANGISAPACVSSVISVGAVYSSSAGRVNWGDCVDAPVAPDQVVCFSNSAVSLSLLAPGTFWTVANKGGLQTLFSGTSAAVPAAAGAVALLREARPELPATAVAGILRSTGKALTDPRNGVITPRLDALAALQLSGPSYAAYAGDAVPIPDGTGSATATAEVSGFAGSVASVLAWVQIDHDRPQHLTVTLTGPDGTTVVLQDGTGQSDHPINAVYGKTAASAQPLVAFQGKPANGVWTLTVQDSTAGFSGRIRNFSITLVPGQPAEPIPALADGRVLAVVGRIQGTHFFQSDVRLYNPEGAAKTFSLYFVPNGRSGAQAVKATRTVEPGEVLALNDVVFSEYGYDQSIGEMTVLAEDADFFVTSRAYTRGANGTFGQFVPGFRTSSGLGPGVARASANGLVRSAQFHTNVGFTEVSGSSATVRMDVLSATGVLLGSVTRTARPNETILLTDVITSFLGLGSTSNFRVDFTLTSATGRVVPFATLVDDATGDGLFAPAVDPSSSAQDVIVAQASHATGANNDFFRTNLHVTNLGSAAVSITVSLIPRVLTGTPNPPRVYTLAPGQTIEKLDVLASEFGLADPSAAGLRIHPSGPARLRVSTRTFVEKFGGTFGFFIPGLTVSEAIGAGEGRVTAIQLDQTSAADGYRSNFGFAEVAGAGATVRVTVRDGADGALLGAKSYALGGHASFQASLNDILTSGAPVSNIYLHFAVESGAGRVLAYGVAVDNTSGDAIYIPAQREP